MAVIEYKEGEHRSGFIGFRVDTTIGGKRYQEYYSIQAYGWDLAEEHAYNLNDKWRKRAEKFNKQNRILWRDEAGTNGPRIKLPDKKRNQT